MELENAKPEFIIEVYRQSVASKHHYDVISWTIGAMSLVVVGFIISHIPDVNSGNSSVIFVKKAGLVAFSWVFLFVWSAIYERNRFWAEVANEKIRDIERQFQVDGIGLWFMKSNFSKMVEFKNTDANGVPYDGRKESTEKCREASYHFNVRYLIIATAFLAAFACFI